MDDLNLLQGDERRIHFSAEWIPKNPSVKAYDAVLRKDSRILFQLVKVSAIAIAGTFLPAPWDTRTQKSTVGRNKPFMLKLMTTMLPGMR